MGEQTYEWWPVRDSRKARWFWGSQAALSLMWTTLGVVNVVFGGSRFWQAFLWLGPAFIAFVALGATRPRLRVDADGLHWRGFLRSSSVRWLDVAVIKVSDAAFHPMTVTLQNGDSVPVPGDAIGWVFDDADARADLLSALRLRAEQHGYRVESGRDT